MIFSSILAGFEIVLFITNDIIGYDVYNASNLGFWGYFVMASQIYSVCMVIYFMAMVVLSFMDFGSKIEVVEKSSISNPVNEEIKEEKHEKQEKETRVEEVKRISQTKVNKDIPFMEEII